MGKITFTGDDIAAAFNRPLPSTICATCGHRRGDHRREIVKPGIFDGIEAHHECERRDRRRKSGTCPCQKFAEPSAACKTCGGEDVRCEDCGEAFGW